MTKPRTDELTALAIVTTADAAKLLNRTPQTLRKWACYEDGPMRPIRINGRLGWRIVDIVWLLNGKATEYKTRMPNTIPIARKVSISNVTPNPERDQCRLNVTPA
jgi:hypothetical protein